MNFQTHKNKSILSMKKTIENNNEDPIKLMWFFALYLHYKTLGPVVQS